MHCTFCNISTQSQPLSLIVALIKHFILELMFFPFCLSDIENISEHSVKKKIIGLVYVQNIVEFRFHFAKLGATALICQ